MRRSSSLRFGRSTHAPSLSVTGASSREDVRPHGGSTRVGGRRSPRLELELDDKKEQGILDRLQAKRVPEWMLAYLAVAWVALQLGDALREIWNWPVGLLRGITMALALGALPVAVIAWHHGEKGEQRVSAVEVLTVSALVVGSAWLIWIVCA